jgi:hypothetical protein
MPASLGPGLRTVSGAKVSKIMAAYGFAGLDDRLAAIDAEFLGILPGQRSHGLPPVDRGRWQSRPISPRSPDVLSRRLKATVRNFLSRGLKATMRRWHRRPILPPSPERSQTLLSWAGAWLKTGGIHRYKSQDYHSLRSGDFSFAQNEKNRGSGLGPSIATWHKRLPKAATSCHNLAPICRVEGPCRRQMTKPPPCFRRIHSAR